MSDKPDLFSNLPTAAEEKAAAFERHEANETAAEYVLRCRHALLSLVQRNATATIEDVRAAVPVPEHLNATVLGIVPGSLARFGAIKQAGYIKGGRRESHARPIAVWALASAECVYLWIAANPLKQ